MYSIYDPTIQNITVNEITNAIRNFSNNKSPGPSLIPYEVYKHLGPVALNTLVLLFNAILDTGIIPDDWMTGNIVLIPKPKEWEDNLKITRPITLLESARKIFMKIINN